MSDEEFKSEVIEHLTELRTQMRALVGDGQPGRIALLEQSVLEHEVALRERKGVHKAFLWIAASVGSVASAALQYFLLSQHR